MNGWLSIHLIAVVCWFAGLFYLPRLYVYHAMTGERVIHDQFKIMERKLYRAITTPSMVIVLISGGAMAHPFFQMGVGITWLYLKLACVAMLVVYHFYLGHCLRVFAADANQHSHKYYRWLNEFPSVMLVAVVLLVVYKPSL